MSLPNESPMSDDFRQRSRNFVDWLRQSGAIISPKIDLQDLRSRAAGRGVIALEDIADDEELFQIPRHSTLATDTSSLSPELRSLTAHDPWLSLILAMVFEYQLGASSKWKAYFDVLPTHFDSLMFWSESDLQHLRGSAVVDKIGKEMADKTFQDTLVPTIRAHTSAFRAANLSDNDLLSLCHRMGSTVMAYAFDLEPSPVHHTEQDGWEEDSDDDANGATLAKGMVPLADMLNADADRKNAKLYYEDDQFVMRATQCVSRGDELFNDYGPLPTADTLRRYGYTTVNYARYDVVEISLELIHHVAQKQLDLDNRELETRTAYLESHGVLDTSYDVAHGSNEDGQFSVDLCVLLNALVAPLEEFAELQKKGRLPTPDLSGRALWFLNCVLDCRAAMYHAPPSQLDIGGIDGRTPTDKDQATRRATMAARVIQGEKAVLSEAAETIQRHLGDPGKKRKTDGDTLSYPNAKKTREG